MPLVNISAKATRPELYPHKCMYCSATEPRLGPYHQGPTIPVIDPAQPGIPRDFTPYLCNTCLRSAAETTGLADYFRNDVREQADNRVELADRAAEQAREGLEQLQAQVHALEEQLAEKRGAEQQVTDDRIAELVQAAVAEAITPPGPAPAGGPPERKTRKKPASPRPPQTDPGAPGS